MALDGLMVAGAKERCRYRPCNHTGAHILETETFVKAALPFI